MRKAQIEGAGGAEVFVLISFRIFSPVAVIANDGYCRHFSCVALRMLEMYLKNELCILPFALDASVAHRDELTVPSLSVVTSDNILI